MRIDAHQHFWNYDSAEYPWINEKLSILKRNYLPEDLAPELMRSKLDGTVAVQARQSIKESKWLLELAATHSIIKGVVGWVDLRSPQVEQDLTELSRNPKFVGVRHVVQDESDERFMLRPDFNRGIAKLKRFGLKYDILIFPNQIPAAIELARQFPEQPFVLDHIAKPSVREGMMAPWDHNIRELARFPNVMCKVSGMVTEARWKQWREEDFRPYLDVVFEAFGEDRLMYGSDWPVALLGATDYQQVYQLAFDYFKPLSEAAQQKVFGGNAAKFYGLK